MSNMKTNALAMTQLAKNPNEKESNVSFLTPYKWAKFFLVFFICILGYAVAQKLGPAFGFFSKIFDWSRQRWEDNKLPLSDFSKTAQTTFNTLSCDVAVTTMASTFQPPVVSALTAGLMCHSMFSRATSAPTSVPTVDVKTWLSIMGGGSDDYGRSIIKTSDSGYIWTGYAGSYGAGGQDVIVAKLFNDGSLNWTKSFGGSHSDLGYSIIETSDNNYVLTGSTNSYGSGIGANADMLVMKLSGDGSKLWAKTLGHNSGVDVGLSVMEASDGSYIVTGYTQSIYATGSSDILLATFSSSDGTLGWAKVIGDTSPGYGHETIEASNGNYILTGFTAGNPLALEFTLTGLINWNMIMGNTPAADYSWSIISVDDGYVLAGWSDDYGVNLKDMLVVKLTIVGQVTWAKAIGGNGDDLGHCIIKSSAGGYVLAGYTNSYGAGTYDIIAAKLADDGSIEWIKTIGAAGSTSASYRVIEDSDGGYIIIGHSDEVGVHNSLVVKLDREGNGVNSPLVIEDHTSDFIQTDVSLTAQSPVLSNPYITSSVSTSTITGSITVTDVTLGVSFYGEPTISPNGQPTSDPSSHPSSLPSSNPTSPTGEPTSIPTLNPTIDVKTWLSIMGGSQDDYGRSIANKIGGGYIMTGGTNSYGAGDFDVLVANLNSDGSINWAKALGGTNKDSGYSVVSVSDGSYMISANTFSFGAGQDDQMLISLDSNGGLNWARTFGGSGSEYNANMADALVETSDGGFISATPTYSYGPGQDDILIMKLTSAGAISWANAFGGGSDDGSPAIFEASDGGYVFIGDTYSYGAGGRDILLAKLNSAGSVSWAKSFGGSNFDYSNSIIEASDDGIVIAGRAYGYGPGVFDVLVAKFSSAGDHVWTTTFGGSGNEAAWSIIESSDGNLVLTGWTESFGAGDYDVLVAKLNNLGGVIWAKTMGGVDEDFGYSIIESSGGGYVLTGQTKSDGAGNIDVLTVKLDEDGNGVSSSLTIADHTSDFTVTNPSLTLSSQTLTVNDVTSSISSSTITGSITATDVTLDVSFFGEPTIAPTGQPSADPSSDPSSRPTGQPSIRLTVAPTGQSQLEIQDSVLSATSTGKISPVIQSRQQHYAQGRSAGSLASSASKLIKSKKDNKKCSMSTIKQSKLDDCLSSGKMKCNKKKVAKKSECETQSSKRCHAKFFLPKSCNDQVPALTASSTAVSSSTQSKALKKEKSKGNQHCSPTAQQKTRFDKCVTSEQSKCAKKKASQKSQCQVMITQRCNSKLMLPATCAVKPSVADSRATI